MRPNGGHAGAGRDTRLEAEHRRQARGRGEPKQLVANTREPVEERRIEDCILIARRDKLEALAPQSPLLHLGDERGRGVDSRLPAQLLAGGKEHLTASDVATTKMIAGVAPQPGRRAECHVDLVGHLWVLANDRVVDQGAGQRDSGRAVAPGCHQDGDVAGQMTGGSNERPVSMKRRKHGPFVSMPAQRRIEIRALACHLVESNESVRDTGRTVRKARQKTSVP